MVFKKGQVSTYLKPLTAVLMAVMLIILIVVVLRFGSGVMGSRASYELQSQAPKIKDHIMSCFSVKDNFSRAGIVLNRSELGYLKQFYNYMEPDCAEDFNYGWNATVKLEYLPGVTHITRQGKASVVLIIDTSGSMKEKGSGSKTRLDKVKEAALKFIDLIKGDVKVGIVTFSINAKLIQPLTSDKALLKSKINSISNPDGGTSLGSGIQSANSELKRNGEGNLYEILLTDGCPCPSAGYQSAIEEARKLKIVIHTIGFQLTDQPRCACTREDAIKHLDNIADYTGGVRYLAEDLTNLKEVYNKISKQIKEGFTEYGLSETTCSIEPLIGYAGDLNIAFIIDRSYSMDKPVICNYIKDIVSGLKDVGINVKSKVYGMADQPKESFGWFTVRGTWDPKCMDAKTKWTKDFAFDEMRDAKPEGWGPATSWVLDNYSWSDTGKNVIVVFGDHDPTGGCDGCIFEGNGHRLPNCGSEAKSAGSFSVPNSAKLDTNCVDYHGDIDINKFNPWKKYPGDDGVVGYPMDSEVEIMENVSAKARNKGVSVYFLRGKEYLLKKQYQFGDPNVNDAVEAMRNVSKETGGKVYLLGDWNTFLNDLKEQFLKYDLRNSIDTCPNVLYSFGEKEGSLGRSLNDKITVSFPVSVMQNEKLVVPGTLTIEVRDGDLERLVGAIDRVYSIGKSENKSFSSVFEINLDNRIEIGDVEFKRPKKVEYTLSGGVSASDSIVVDEDLRVGVNGEEIFSDKDRLPTTNSSSTYKGKPIKFEAMKSDALEVIAMNFHGPTLELSPLYLHCCNGQMQQISKHIFADKRINETKYNNMSSGFTFYHNFTTINIGKYETYIQKGICIFSGNKKHCAGLKTPVINTLKLEPGHYFLKIKFIPPNIIEVTK